MTEQQHCERGPLAGIRVIEMGQLIAGPFCGQLMGDLGAEVIKIEDPVRGDPLRQWGQARVEGDSLWWSVLARNKKSVTLNLREPAGQAIARELIASADVVLENFRPGSMEKWHLDYESLSADNPALVMTRVSGYGQTGPSAQQPGYGSIGEAMGGLRYIVGDPTTPPSRVGISIGDTLAAIFATLGTLAALLEVKNSGRGQVVDASIYESVLGVMESLVPDWIEGGIQRERTGSILPKIAPSNVYPTGSGEWMIIAANQDTVFARLAAAMGRPELAEDPRYANHYARGEHQAELDELIAEFSMTKTSQELTELLQAHSVPVGKIFRPRDMVTDPQFIARESIIAVDSEQHGSLHMHNAFPRLSRTDTRVRWSGPVLGKHTAEILTDLGYDAQRQDQLRAAGVIR
ncbi:MULTISPECIES: CaiB/BaiF CoA-transferase family protein [Auritidibacter]|uniref:CaiB/BaiF CoA transferase family protein n=1 Tax=Auritidibacter TaxID=1160973 RepID=UPI000D7368F7|nr:MULTISPECIES: CoA transferase [Auritidibacter]PXA79218.1 formyl-CoA transferase [Auritidibacter sp. NML120636]WGH90404.1 CoA transferase [Auritidibacter ignavus]